MSDGNTDCPELLWGCGHFTDLLHRHWEDEFFIFNPHTGHTHILNQLGWQLLSACAVSPRSEHYLIELVLASAPDQDNAQLRESVLGHLSQLQQLELVQMQTAPCN